jgi:hypothetical protein
MANFYAIYPPAADSTNTVQTVQGEGTPGAQTGGVLTVQGDPSGTPIPVTATNPSVGATGSAVPADATYAGMNVSGNLTGLTGTSNGLKVDGSAVNQPVVGTGTAGSAASGVVTIQGIASMTPVKVDPSGGGTGPVNVVQFGGNNVVTGTGASGNGIPRVTVSNDSTVGLVAGSAIIGKVGIDQTTPGTTNGVQVNAALPAGANTIGAVTQASGPWTVTGSGTAGTAASGVVTIQGIASMTPVKVDPSGGTGAVNVTQFGGNNVVTGTGTSGAGIPRVTVSSDSSLTSVTTVSTVTAVTAITNTVNVTGTGTTGSPAAGILTIQGNASGVAVPVTVSSLSPTTPTTAIFSAEGNIAAGSITSSFQTVFTPASNTKILFMRNNTNATCAVSMDAGTTTNWNLDSGDQVSIDFQSNAMVCTTTAIQVKSSGSPSTGSFRVNAVHT